MRVTTNEGTREFSTTSEPSTLTQEPMKLFFDLRVKRGELALFRAESARVEVLLAADALSNTVGAVWISLGRPNCLEPGSDSEGAVAPPAEPI